MFNRIDRYILFMFLGYFVGGLLVFLTLFGAIDAMSTLVNFKGVEMHYIAQYYFNYLPEIAYRLLPVACLLATIFTVSTLNRANELVALFASGMSLLRITAPILISVALISAFGFYLSDRVLPKLADQKHYIYYTYMKKNPSLYSTVKTNRIWYRSKNLIFNVKTLNEQNRSAQGLTFYYFNDDWDLVQMITAREASIGEKVWQLADGSLTLFTNETSFPLTANFKNKTISMGEDAKDLASTGHTSDVLSVKELEQFIHKNKDAGLDTVRYEVDYQAKFGFVFTALVMCLLGIPFSVGKARSGGIMANVGICLGLIFAYWVLYNSSITLGRHGQLPPIVAAWFANVSMGSMAYYFLKRLKR